jgi:hypothetical protein
MVGWRYDPELAPRPTTGPATVLRCICGEILNFLVTQYSCAGRRFVPHPARNIGAVDSPGQ